MENKKRVGRPKGSTNRMNTIQMDDFKKDSIGVILHGHYSWKDYQNYCRGRGLSEPRCNVLWKEIWEDIRSKSELSKEQMVSKHLIKYWDIYDEALNKNDLTNARQALNDIAKMFGLNEPDKMDINQTGVIRFNFGDEPNEETPNEDDTDNSI